MAKMKPLGQVKEMLRGLGWMADECERRIPHTQITKDLFGWCDLVAIKEQNTIGIQVTTPPNVSARVGKCVRSLEMIRCLRAGWGCYVWGVRDKVARDYSTVIVRQFLLVKGEKIAVVNSKIYNKELWLVRN